MKKTTFSRCKTRLREAPLFMISWSFVTFHIFFERISFLLKQKFLKDHEMFHSKLKKNTSKSSSFCKFAGSSPLSR